MAASIIGARACIAIPTEWASFMLIDVARLDLMEHFITADKLRPGAAASKAAAILRIAEPEWYAAKRAFIRAERKKAADLAAFKRRAAAVAATWQA